MRPPSASSTPRRDPVSTWWQRISYLEYIHGRRTSGFSAPVVFVSSNVNDYAERPGTGLPRDLAADFAAAQMRYAPAWQPPKAFLNL